MARLGYRRGFSFSSDALAIAPFHLRPTTSDPTFHLSPYNQSIHAQEARLPEIRESQTVNLVLANLELVNSYLEGHSVAVIRAHHWNLVRMMDGLRGDSVVKRFKSFDEQIAAMHSKAPHIPLDSHRREFHVNNILQKRELYRQYQRKI